MAARNKATETSELDSGKALAGVLALLVAEREERNNGRGGPRKTELILADAGLAIADIARVTGKSYDAVKQTLRRNRGR
jgi:DNA-directed RNA polymerase specialized sigma24 family protein